MLLEVLLLYIKFVTTLYLDIITLWSIFNMYYKSDYFLLMHGMESITCNVDKSFGNRPIFDVR